jgi:hypothetical protein
VAVAAIRGAAVEVLAVTAATYPVKTPVVGHQQNPY